MLAQRLRQTFTTTTRILCVLHHNCFTFILFPIPRQNNTDYKLMIHSGISVLRDRIPPKSTSACLRFSHIRTNFPRNLIFIFLIFGARAELSLGLRILHVTIPSAVESGEMAQLICDHDTEDEALYAVKWYKGAREFFRYTPKEIPAVKIFSFPGLHIDVSIRSHCRTASKYLNSY